MARYFQVGGTCRPTSELQALAIQICAVSKAHAGNLFIIVSP